MPATGLWKNCEVDETYDIMESLNSVKYNLSCISSLRLNKLSPLMRCLTLKVFTVFRNICFHRTASNSKLNNQMLVWLDLCAFLCNVSSLKKIVRNNRWFQKMRWSSRRVRQGSDASLEHNFYKSSQDRFRQRLF